MNEFGVPSYKQYTDGDAMMFVDGKKYRYKGTIPLSMSPWAVAEHRRGLPRAGPDVQVDSARSAVEAPRRRRSGTRSAWRSGWTRNTPSKRRPRAAGDRHRGHLHLGRLGGVAAVRALPDGIGRRAELRAGRQGRRRGRPAGRRHGRHPPADGRRARRRDPSVAAGAAASTRTPTASRFAPTTWWCAHGVSIVAVPIAIASQIIYEPMLPVDRSFLHQRMPVGAVFKIALVYDEPFWRADGLSGQSSAPGSPATSPSTPARTPARPGVLCVITEGPDRAPDRASSTDAERRQGGARRTRRTVRRQGRVTGRLRRAELDASSATPAAG